MRKVCRCYWLPKVHCGVAAVSWSWSDWHCGFTQYRIALYRNTDRRVFYAFGSGLIEVLCSPIVEACPFEHKEKVMSLLHSFYCWGSVGVILLSTLYFAIFGIDKWQILACVWAIIPLYNIYNLLLARLSVW